MERTNDGKYLIDSSSKPGVYYTIEYVEVAGPAGWELRCNCPAAQHNKRCWHVAACAEAEAARHQGAAA